MISTAYFIETFKDEILKSELFTSKQKIRTRFGLYLSVLHGYHINIKLITFLPVEMLEVLVTYPAVRKRLKKIGVSEKRCRPSMGIDVSEIRKENKMHIKMP